MALSEQKNFDKAFEVIEYELALMRIDRKHRRGEQLTEKGEVELGLAIEKWPGLLEDVSVHEGIKTLIGLK